MQKMTEMQRAYAQNRAAGLNQRESAVAAGYAAPTADRQGATLEKRADIQKAIKEFRKGRKDAGVEVSLDADERNKMPKAKYTDSIVFLTDLMNHKHVPLAMRADAAKQLLPYQHARIAEKGKKENTKERADRIAKGGKSKFATKAPPALKLVGGSG